MRKNLLQGILYVLPLAALLGVVVYRVMVRNETVTAGYNATHRALLSSWMKCDFVAISELSLDRIREIEIVDENSNLLGEDQTEALFRMVFDLVTSHHEGSFEKFLRYRVPSSNPRFDQHVLTGYREALDSLGSELPPDASPIDVLEGVWRYSNQNQDKSREGYELMCTRCWNSLCIDRSRITILRRSEALSLEGYLDDAEVVSKTSFKGFVAFEPSPGDIIASRNQITYSIVKLMPRNDLDPPFPLFFLFYWAGDGGWLPAPGGLVLGFGDRQYDLLF